MATFKDGDAAFARCFAEMNSPFVGLIDHGRFRGHDFLGEGVNGGLGDGRFAERAGVRLSIWRRVWLSLASGICWCRLSIRLENELFCFS